MVGQLEQRLMTATGKVWRFFFWGGGMQNLDINSDIVYNSAHSF
jgi:hypothetical protein